MSGSNYDVIVVGAGHNTLTTAAYLAKCGLGVLVLEKEDIPAGGCTTREVTLPGFKHDVGATAVVHLQGHPLLVNDELELKSKFGLEFVYPEISFMTVFDDGDTLACYQSLDKTCAEIAKYSEKDAQAYRDMAKFMEIMSPLVSMSVAKPPPPFGRLISLLEQTVAGQEMVSIIFKSTYDIVLEKFEHPKVQMHFAKWCSEMLVGAEEKTTGMTLLFLIGSSHSHPAGAVIGGTLGLSEAMVRCIEQYGGEVRFNTLVTRVINVGGQVKGVQLADGATVYAKKAVVGAFHPHILGDVVDGLDPGLVARAKKTQSCTFGGMLIHAALKEAPQWQVGTQPDNCLCINMIDTMPMESFRRVFDDLKYGTLPKHFFGYASVHTNYDKTRAPEGKHTLYFFTWAPYHLSDGGAARWDEIKESRADWAMAHLAKYCPNVSGDNIIKRCTESPLDLSRRSPSFIACDLTGVAMFLYQFFDRRPTPELAQYRVPGAQGLYLSGPCMHPGGGLTGGGRAAAIRIMGDLKVDYHSVITS